MINRLAFDIETMADPEMVKNIPEPEVAVGNLKDPVKIEAKRKQARADQIGKAALDPHFSRVLCITIAGRDGRGQGHFPADVETRFRSPAGDPYSAERDLLVWFWNNVVAHWSATGTHNGPLLTPTGDSIPATGKKAQVSGSTTYEFKDGVIARNWVFWDMASLLSQLGLMPG